MTLITVRDCHETITSFSDGNLEISQRIQKWMYLNEISCRFDPSSTPLDFMFRQLFHRLFIMSPAFIRVCFSFLLSPLEESEYIYVVFRVFEGK